jgi:RNA polymerase sigma-70 factor (ECF subfamily)
MSNLDLARADESSVGAPLPQAHVVTFDVVYEQYADFVWRNARRLGVAESALDDVVQDVFVVTHRRLASLRGSEVLRAWLFSILLRVVRNHLRGIRRKNLGTPSAFTDPDQLPASGHTSPHANAELSDAARTLHALLQELPVELREVFVLAEVEEMPSSDISRALGVNTNTIQSRLKAARREFNEAALRWRARDEWRMR